MSPEEARVIAAAQAFRAAAAQSKHPMFAHSPWGEMAEICQAVDALAAARPRPSRGASVTTTYLRFDGKYWRPQPPAPEETPGA